MTTELLPRRTLFSPDEPVVIEARGLTGDAELTVHHLGDRVATSVVRVGADIDLGRLPVGAYGVEMITAAGSVVRTAVQVIDDPRQRLRYGFVADFAPQRDVRGVVDQARRLHLTAVQYYDWAYRHADLVGGGEHYVDALGQSVSLDSVRRLVSGLRAVGAASLGYAAVYAVGDDDWAAWNRVALQRPSGSPYSLGDFLRLVDPAAPRWLEHFANDLAAAIAAVGFDGFHLDQYGYPRWAIRPDGSVVDVARSFHQLITRVRDRMPEAVLVFNNVNDFPTWVTARSPQDAVYIEVWPPHVTLASLARVVDRARAAGRGKPVVIAAYQHVYSTARVEQADLAASFTMATLFSHGASHLFAGEGDRILVDPYYVHSHRASGSTLALLTRWYNFAVEHDELLMDDGIAEVGGAWLGGYNDALAVEYPDVTVTSHPSAGSVWCRVTDTGSRLVVHLVNLVGQVDTCWDEPREPVWSTGLATLRVRRVRPDGLPRVSVADPDRQPRLRDIGVRVDGDFIVAELPEPHVWQMVSIELDPR
ncbi:glycoside hydrolase family 66 protein [soil metagenome]